MTLQIFTYFIQYCDCSDTRLLKDVIEVEDSFAFLCCGSSGLLVGYKKAVINNLVVVSKAEENLL